MAVRAGLRPGRGRGDGLRETGGDLQRRRRPRGVQPRPGARDLPAGWGPRGARNVRRGPAGARLPVRARVEPARRAGLEAGDAVPRRAPRDRGVVPRAPRLGRAGAEAMRLVVTGAGGPVARSFLAQMPSHHDVVPLAHADLDVGDHHAVMRTVVPLHPDAIVNLAAMTRVDDCELEQEEAYRSNTTGPHNLALAARSTGAVLLHVSTDYVFDGGKESPYDELDRPYPISVYARSKLGGEERVRASTPEHFVVRTGWIFGGGPDHLSRTVERMR